MDQQNSDQSRQQLQNQIEGFLGECSSTMCRALNTSRDSSPSWKCHPSISRAISGKQACKENSNRHEDVEFFIINSLQSIASMYGLQGW